MLSDNMKFLVIDDFSNMREYVKNLLKEIGCLNVDEAEDGLVALQKLRTGKFDFVISSWRMPSMDGLTMLQNIRAIAELRNIPILMVVAEINKKHIVDAVQAGANGFLAKPFTAPILLEKLNLIAKNNKSSASV
ncbi:response regulator [Nitrosomonas aestuarii]|uniref:response regulator n=1 Tax=Nitrosomonas aestuarii TaxID=52441 RepID=UPI000D3188A4|nr:response regulator [Nitrosomonas aestuarii]PTN12585.1 two-component system chemotaxis response regulator CheY [Nitrosomonas aestuarii]